MRVLKTIKLLSVMLLIAASFTSCFSYEEVEIRDIKSVKLKEFSTNGLVVESEIKLYNPNKFDIKVVNSDFDVYVEGSKICKSRIDNKISIPRESEAYHTLIFKSDYKDLTDGALPKLIGITAMGKDEIDFKVDGSITGKAYIFKKKVKVSHEGKVPLKLF